MLLPRDFAPVAILLALLLQPGLAAAAGEREKARLETVREQRAALEKKLKDAEASRAAAAVRLRDTERAIAASARKLRALEAERAATGAALAAHERELRRLADQMAARQDRLARMLRHQPAHAREADALAILLAGGDRDAAERDRHFLTLLSRAQASLIAGLRHDAAETRRLTGEVQRRGEKLAELAQREEAERANLRRRQQERQAVLTRISGQIETQQQRIATLRQDERRLARLIAELAQQARARPGRPARPERPPRSGQPPPAQTVQADPVGARGEFARLRGRLIQPVKGAVTGRFGARRADGQSVWKGLFIRAAEGAEVRAVAAGTVVFADWLRGYGNLLIIDHDDDFLSVYGNNQTLLAEVGQRVAAGRTVATVGAGGGQEESGLYFELRHRGQAFDPGRWLGAP